MIGRLFVFLVKLTDFVSRNGSGKSEAWTGFGKAESTMEKLLRQVRDPHRGLYSSAAS